MCLVFIIIGGKNNCCSWGYYLKQPRHITAVPRTRKLAVIFPKRASKGRLLDPVRLLDLGFSGFFVNFFDFLPSLWITYVLHEVLLKISFHLPKDAYPNFDEVLSEQSDI